MNFEKQRADGVCGACGSRISDATAPPSLFYCSYPCQLEARAFWTERKEREREKRDAEER